MNIFMKNSAIKLLLIVAIGLARKGRTIHHSWSCRYPPII